jgi:transposase
VNVLNLPGWNILETETDDRTLILHVQHTLPPKACPHCGCVANLYGHGGKVQDFRDTQMHGKRCILRVSRRRFRCRECLKTFLERLPGIDDGHRMTERLVRYIERETLERTHVAVAVELGLHEKTVRLIFNAFADRLRAAFKVETPVWLGLDELHILGKPRAIFTNILERTIVDLLEDRSQKTIVDYLIRMPNRQSIELVTMDMWNPYRLAVRACLPQAKIVVDKYHVVRMASDCLETVRKACHADLTSNQRKTLKRDRFTLLKRRRNLSASDMLKLDVWTGQFPALMAAYEAKETFYEMFDREQTPAEARAQYRDWLKSLDEKTATAFQPVVTAIGNWNAEVFAYFDHRVTNAYTEAMNGITRVVNRMGRGYSFDALRAKMLFRSPRKVKVPSPQPKAEPLPEATAPTRVFERGSYYRTTITRIDDFDIVTAEAVEDVTNLGVAIAEWLAEVFEKLDHFNTEGRSDESCDSTQNSE